MTGLSSTVLEQIKEALKKTPTIHHAYLFGSRALGRHRPGSDIDLAVEGDQLKLDDILSIMNHLDDLMLPYRFDVVDRSKVDAVLQDHINRVGIKIF